MFFGLVKTIHWRQKICNVPPLGFDWVYHRPYKKKRSYSFLSFNLVS